MLVLVSEHRLNKLYMTTAVGNKFMLKVDDQVDEYTVVYKDAVRVELSKDENNHAIISTTWAGLFNKLNF